MTKTKLTFGLSKCWQAITTGMLTVLLTTSVQAQGYSCIGEVNANLGAACLRDLNYGELLTPGSIPNFGTVQVKRFGSWAGPGISKSDIGSRFEVRVTSTDGLLTCWGWVLVEDKTKPVIACPAPILVNCLTDAYNLEKTGKILDLNAIPFVAPRPIDGSYTDCSSATITYTDVTVDRNCTDPLGVRPLTATELATLGAVPVVITANASVIKVIKRTFKVTDIYGNFEECVQYIGVKRLDNTMTIMPPFETTISCHTNVSDFSPEALAARAASRAWSAYPILFVSKTGVAGAVCPADTTAARALLATYDTIHLKPDNSTCGITVSYNDQELNLCSGSFKKLRQWRVLDWCGTNVNVCRGAAVGATLNLNEQVIKYLDLTPPTVSAYYTDYITTRSYLCTRDVNGNIITDSIGTGDSRRLNPAAVFKQDVAATEVTKTFNDYLVEFGRNGVTGDIRSLTPGAPHAITALGDANTCGGNVVITLKATDISCVSPGARVSMISSDTRLTVASGYPRYDASTGETEYKFTGTFPFAPIPYPVTFTVTDGCGYAKAVQKFEITVIDNAKPQPICIEYLQLALGTDGKVRLQAENLNRASVDNCTNQRNLTYLIRRMTNVSADGTEQVENTDECYRKFVDFNCYDAWSTYNSLNNNARARTIGVVMRVCDEFGNYNDCMVQVLVEDKIRPTCVAPANVTINCNKYANLWNTAQYGTPAYYDNCDATIEELTADFNLNNCRQGTITRNWTVTDKFGNTNSGTCRQVITVKSISDFTVDFPDDIVANCFGEVATADAAKNAMLTNPITADGHLENNGCGVLAVEVSDRVADATTDGSCYKIFRKYRVIDWCRYSPNNNNDNVNSYGRPVAGDKHRTGFAWNNAVNGNAPAWENLHVGTATGQTSRIGDQIRERKFRDADTFNFSGNVASLDIAKIYAANTFNTNFANTHKDFWTFADGVIAFTQVIKLVDNVAPVVVAIPDALETCDYGSASNCAARYDVTLQATDACQGGVSTEGLTYSWTIAKQNAPTTILYRGTTARILVESLPYDSIYIVKWTAEDKCGNAAHDEYLLQFRDCKKPSVVCAVVNAEIMPLNGTPGAGGSIEIWARELFVSVSDNCTDRSTLERKVRVRKAGTGTGYPSTTTAVTFTCDDYNATADHTAQVEVWTQDNAGNADFCLATVTLQNNMGACGGGATDRATVSGGVKTELRSNIENVAVKASLNGTVMGAFTTRADGAFTIGGLTMGQNYAVRGERTDNPLNGVTTYDIALVSRHILGSETLNTPYKIIAADVNGDRDINTADMISLRRLILHISTTLPNNIPSWRFVNGDYTFRNRENPLGEDFPEVVNATNATRTNAASFVGIKVGDLNSSATANGLEGLGIRGAAGTLTLKTDDLNLVAGKTYTVKLSATEFNVIGMQGTFNFAKGYVDQISVTGQLPNMGEGNFGLFDNAVTTSWNGKAIAETDVLTLTFRAKQNGKLSEVLTVGSNLTYAEGYNATGESFSVNLQFNNGKVTGNEFTLYQNEPNPFDGTTKIGFSLPEAANATLTVYDATGKILSVKEGNYTSGYNAINISKTDVNANGVLFYRLDSGNNTATKKMIIIE
ncbi:MAG: hypothetical protein RIS64_3159 [Bacteroidota bacterium]